MFTDVRLREVWSHLESGGAQALTLDVFDTLLWRMVPEPAHAFITLGHRLAEIGQLPTGVTPGEFARLRVYAEHKAREHSHEVRGTYEVRLDEIWGVLVPALPGAGSLGDLMDVELAVERDLCRADLAVVELAELAMTKLGLPVYLLSDTYFSAAQLERLLSRPELAGVPFTQIFTSSDAGISKSDGLFRHMLAASNLQPSRVVHLGDHPVADVESAREHGLVAIHYPKYSGSLKSTLELEGLLTGPGDDTPIDSAHGDYGMTALRARSLHRADAAAVPPGLRRYWETGATVFGPVFTGFADWAVERTRDHGADHIYCLMREGEFLSRLVAEPGADAGVTTSTLWASRQVCALSNVFEGSPEELRSFLVRRHAPSVGQLLRQLGVAVDDVAGISSLADRRLDVPGLLDDTLEALCSDERIRSEIVLTAARLRDRYVQYLDTQLPESGRIVVADLGWGGTIQALLARLLASTGRDFDVCGLYLATNAAAGTHRLAGLQIEGYAASGGQPELMANQLMRSPEVLEQLCMPDIGSLVSFDDEHRPVLSIDRTSRTQVAQRVAVQDGILAFQREWLRYRRSETAMPSLSEAGARHSSLRMLTRFVARPTAAEASAFGAWAHDDNFGSDSTEGLLPPELVRRMPYLTPADVEKITMRELYWPAGVAGVANRSLAVISGLAAAAGVRAEEVSPEAAAGPVEVYVDTGGDFVNGHKETVVTRSGRDGMSIVRLRVEGVGARRVRIDPAGRRGLLRLDWLTISFHLHNAPEPYKVTVTSLDDLAGQQLALIGLRTLQANLLEIVGDDPQIIYTIDHGTQPQLGGTYAIDVEMAFGWLGIRADPLQVRTADAARTGLPVRAARKIRRELGGLR
ncbi:haloacid dehalogenase superfamily, subfamily IA, variant 1 with third motif having Dx(3-4)D or Dx(3-4)E [Parafrankia irregularis]|uniref:Haloacid dehalogenase superfamily, subfamily IA, variant 1 with third motif having Dx(3-4)D or Dx(3-4)E n=1 Tax=Parafrankia irregularis TaxID=795642 RepID=A0A0S4QH77_9ACTN|nr:MULTISPECIES: haloacid dehalogenase [Parafrankia]MBE3202891.1 haloacid dehalogenase [Parafrankia sp. CH37]CUU54482.1 haloacid dehalogenase superfamily, subfamily IA, variant 1 with third motif having Dx(3-4)D or Dx(3-4)E [Parafrankia irregularis]